MCRDISVVELLSSFRFAVFRFTIEMIDPLELPEKKGSMLRGVFGHAFRRVACACARDDCTGCTDKERCVYSYVFETIPPQNVPFLRSMDNAPHPFALRPPVSRRRRFKPATELTFELVLIGLAIDYLPYFVKAFIEMGDIGFGPTKGRFFLKRADSLGLNDEYRIIYNYGDAYLRDRAIVLTCSDMLQQPAPQSYCTFQFLSPFCFREKGCYLRDIPRFEILFRILLRRITVLAHMHCGIDCSGLDFGTLCHAANTVQKVSTDFKLILWDRYSNRQEKKHPMGGMNGTGTFLGDFSLFWPFMLLGEQVHVGKHTSFGLGQYRLLVAPSGGGE
jgi:hypothetical protein